MLEATNETPEVIFDPTNNKFFIGKRSLPENPRLFYDQVIEWVKVYALSPNPETKFEFQLEYINTSSSKQIMKIISELLMIPKKGKLSICWYYKQIDEDMRTLGERFGNLANFSFDIIGY